MTLARIPKELRSAVRDYYTYQGQHTLTSVKLLKYKTQDGNAEDAILVRFTDGIGSKLSTICFYDGYDGKMFNPKKPGITEFDWTDREYEDEMIENLME